MGHHSSVKPSLTDTLCTRCGLCCDGSLFADVELSGRAEAAGLEVMGLEIEDEDNGLLVQPCAALRGKRCGIYAHRPECCRTFECALLRDARRGAVSVARAEAQIAEALQRIARLLELACELGQSDASLSLKERVADALLLADQSDATPTRSRQRAELEAGMNAVEEFIAKVFLRGLR